ncbi:hypothetical protein NUKP32_02420 [Klebsiella variicola]|nr:hypothetical protein NUKP32_02420 [Klebsiella variicola]GKP07596.1 hypothetical protein NUBL22002_40520 [Klebsiella variicola]
MRLIRATHGAGILSGGAALTRPTIPQPRANAAPPDMGPLKLPVLAASKSLRRSRKAGAARMDAG